MFVQTHFQRSRHLIASNSNASTSSGANSAQAHNSSLPINNKSRSHSNHTVTTATSTSGSRASKSTKNNLAVEQRRRQQQSEFNTGASGSELAIRQRASSASSTRVSDEGRKCSSGARGAESRAAKVVCSKSEGQIAKPIPSSPLVSGARVLEEDFWSGAGSGALDSRSGSDERDTFARANLIRDGGKRQVCSASGVERRPSTSCDTINQKHKRRGRNFLCLDTSCRARQQTWSIGEADCCGQSGRHRCYSACNHSIQDHNQLSVALPKVNQRNLCRSTSFSIVRSLESECEPSGGQSETCSYIQSAAQVSDSLLRPGPQTFAEKSSAISLSVGSSCGLVQNSLGTLDNQIFDSESKATSGPGTVAASTDPRIASPSTWYDLICLCTKENSRFLALFLVNFISHQLESLCQMGRGLFWLKKADFGLEESRTDSQMAPASASFSSNANMSENNYSNDRRQDRHFCPIVDAHIAAAAAQSQPLRRQETSSDTLNAYAAPQRPLQLDIRALPRRANVELLQQQQQQQIAAAYIPHSHRHNHDIQHRAPAVMSDSGNYVIPPARMHHTFNRARLATTVESAAARTLHCAQEHETNSAHLHKWQWHLRHTVDGSPIMQQVVCAPESDSADVAAEGSRVSERQQQRAAGLGLAGTHRNSSHSELASISNPTHVDDVSYAELRTQCWQQQQQAYSMSSKGSHGQMSMLLHDENHRGLRERQRRQRMLELERRQCLGHEMRLPAPDELARVEGCCHPGEELRNGNVDFHSLDAGFNRYPHDHLRHQHNHHHHHRRHQRTQDDSVQRASLIRALVSNGDQVQAIAPPITNGSDSQLYTRCRELASARQALEMARNGSYIHRPKAQGSLVAERHHYQHQQQMASCSASPTSKMEGSRDHRSRWAHEDAPLETCADSPGLIDKHHVNVLVENESCTTARQQSCSAKSNSPDGRGGFGGKAESRKMNQAASNHNGNANSSGGESSIFNNHLLLSTPLGKVSLAGAKRRLGFKQKGLNSLSVQRSEEIYPEDWAFNTAANFQRRQCVTATNTPNSSSFDEPKYEPRWLKFKARSLMTAEPIIEPTLYDSASDSSDPRACFVDGLGAGQIASRQALVSPYLGDIQLSISDQRGMLEVEIIRVRRLQLKPCAKRLPSPYVKVYLMRNKKCIAKFKTGQTKRTLDPMYQQRFIFRDDYSECVLQVIVWGDYGKKDRKCLMGVVQIHLDDLDMSRSVIGWYKLFNALSVTNMMTTSSKALRQTMSTTKIEEQLQRSHSDELVDDEKHQ